MKVIDLGPEHEDIYCQCLEEWAEEMKDAGDHKARWYRRMKDSGLGVKLATDDAGVVGGMIQYVPIEYSMAEGRDLYFVLCIWVHGYKQGRGNFQKRGMGRALLQAAEEDARARGAKGLAVWGMAIPVFMRASWFKKHGYKTADRMSFQTLLWKPFSEDARPPRWIRPNKKPGSLPGRVSVTSLMNGWCPGMNMVMERAKRAAAEFGDKVEFRMIDTFERPAFLEWGISDGLFINNRPVRTGPPPSYDKIKSKIAKRVKKIR